MENKDTAWIPTLKLEKLLTPANFAIFYQQCNIDTVDVELEIRLQLHLDDEKRYFTHKYFTRVSDVEEHTALGDFYGYKLFKLLVNVASGRRSKDFYQLVKHRFKIFESDIQYLFGVDIQFSKRLDHNADERIQLVENTPPLLSTDFSTSRTPSYSESPTEVAARYLGFLAPSNDSPMTQDDFNLLISFVAKAIELPDLPKVPRVLDYVVVGKISRERVTASFCKIQRHYSKKRLPRLQAAMREIFNYGDFETEETTSKNWTTGLKKYFPEGEDNKDN